MKHVYIIQIISNCGDGTTFDLIPYGYKTLEEARGAMGTIIKEELEASWISNFDESDLSFLYNENNYWECEYNDYELFTSIEIVEVEIKDEEKEEQK